MAVAGTHSIFKLDATKTTETAATDKIEFDGTAATPDARSHLTSIRPILNAINTDNPNPGSQDFPNSQDTGNAPFILELEGYFDESGGTALGIDKFRTWLMSSRVLKSNYPKGVFGFRSDTRPEFDIVPTTLGGYQVIHFELKDTLEYSTIPFMCRLKYVGEVSLF